MRIIRSTATALVLAAGLVGANAWAHGNEMHKGNPSTQGTSQGNTSGANPSNQGAQNTAQPKAVDQAFIRDAYDHATEGVALGELATRQGQSDQVKKIGQQIVTDETAALQKLRQVAEKSGMALPQAPPQKEMTSVSNLSKLSGKQFDDAFLAQVRTRDNHALNAFERETKTGKNDDIKTYASDQIPVIRGQLDQLKTGVTNVQPQKGTTNKQGTPNKQPAPKNQPQQQPK